MGVQWGENGLSHLQRAIFYRPGALTIWIEFSVIPGRIQMERFIPVESFRKKVIPFEVFPFSRFDPEFPEIYVPFAHSYSARLFTVILPRKNAKDLKDVKTFIVVMRIFARR